MSEAPVSVGDRWTLVSADGLGTGVHVIPVGAEVVVDAVLPPFSAGVGQVAEDTVSCVYGFADFVPGDGGVLVEAVSSRRLAFAEPVFRALFVRSGGGL